MITGNEIRQRFMDFFARNGHRIVRSSPLLPANDPTLLFINAGMNQFKDLFLGLEQRDYTRAVTTQKCIRAGGKHNDLEEVGKTARHHTFFEMLGNFSFGDYFKEEAIVYAWDFICKELGLELNRLWFTVYKDDDEAIELWKKVGAPADRILRFGEKDNFWQMGDTGPCGPCSEIHYFRGERLADQHPNLVNGTGDDCIEIWNLVFMQYNRDASRTLTPLPKPSVDTGAGLERLAAVLQRTRSNYETDLIYPILEFISKLCGQPYDYDTAAGFSMRVIADHARATAFAITDGIVPGNTDRAYVLRKIMRRAIYHGAKCLQLDDLFFYRVTEFVIGLMSGPYPELLTARNFLTQIVQGEERRFRNTLNTCLPKFHNLVAQTPTQMPGYKDLARLYDTYGMPPDLMKVMLEQQRYDWEQTQFDDSLAELQQHEPVAAPAAAQKAKPFYQELATRIKPTFTGYQGTELLAASVVALIRDEQEVPVLKSGETGEVILASTPFYAESGGQIGDTGLLQNDQTRVQVLDTIAPVSGLITHKVKIETGQLQVTDQVAALVDGERRRRIMLNHTATHLLHAALKEVLGPHIKQAGSLVAPDRLRFDFTHYAALSESEIIEIERLVNDEIQRNTPLTKEEMALEMALNSGAVALFGEKYSSQVRVVSIPGFSKELCGGTHVQATGDIGLFKVVSDSSIAAGIRRLEAITGPSAVERYQQADDILDTLALSFKTGWGELPAQVEKLQTNLKTAQAQVDALKLKLASQAALGLMDQARSLGDIKVLAQKVTDIDRSSMRQLADTLVQKLGSGVVVLGMIEEDKASLVVRVSNDLTKRLHAGKLVKELAAVVGGNGGGRPDLAEAGGREVAKLDNALDAGYQFVAQQLGI
jgi:alanyl-tRNA synthetase